MSVFPHRLVVRFRDCDALGHVNNAVYLQYMQQATLKALDMIEACGLDEKAAALRLECSASQLVRFVADHPPAMERWNAERVERGLHRLRA